MQYGRETFSCLEIDQPLCVHAWGDGVGSPPLVAGGCTAVLGVDGTRKCFKTRATCPVPASYSAGTLTLRFARPQEGLLQYGNVIAAMASAPSTSPASINLAAMDKSSSALGTRESVTISFTDDLHSDLLVDPYRLERMTGAAAFGSPPETYDPYQRGTFWGKWLARNPYFSGYPCRVREGFLGDDLEDMRVRHYVIDRIDGPSDGMVKIVAKDLFSKIEALKAQAPLPSQGELDSGILAADTSATLSPAGIGNEEYPTSGYVAMGDEVSGFTRVGDVLTLARGALGTTASDHDEEDLVQLVLEYTTTSPHRIIYDLMVSYSSIPASAIDLDEWDVLASSVTALFTARIVKPTAVEDLIGEICEQAGLTVWPDVSTGMVRIAALRPTSPSVTVDDDRWIVDGSLSLKRRSEKRASEVWTHYGQKNPAGQLDDAQNYHSRAVEADLEAEGEDQYGTAVIRQVFSRWIPQFGRIFAQETGRRILATFRDAPTEASFALNASKDGELDLAAPFTLRTSDVQDETGATLDVIYMPIEIERGENEINITSMSITFSAGGNDLGGDDRTIFLENDAFNLTLRTIHDSLFTVPVGGSPGETVTFEVIDGVVIGSTSAAVASIRTGTWPSGVHLLLVNNGRIQGKGGRGGEGSNNTGSNDGFVGGDAIEATYTITIDNATGEIWAGGGGAGGGGYAEVFFGVAGHIYVSGGGGGAGAGTDPGDGGGSPFGSPGSPSTSEAGGTGGTGETFVPGTGGTGADGGGPGLPGGNGTAGTGGFTNGPGGTGAPAGRYILGNSFVIWTALGDVRGNVA